MTASISDMAKFAKNENDYVILQREIFRLYDNLNPRNLAELNYPDEVGNTPLMLLLHNLIRINSESEKIKSSIKNLEDREIALDENSSGLFPAAKRFQKADLSQKIADKKMNLDDLITIKAACLGVAETLITIEGVDLNHQNHDEGTALYYANKIGLLDESINGLVQKLNEKRAVDHRPTTGSNSTYKQ